MLVTSIFFFSHNVLNPFNENSIIWVKFNPLPNDKVLDMTKLKAFADDKLNIAKMTDPLVIEKKTLWKKKK